MSGHLEKNQTPYLRSKRPEPALQTYPPPHSLSSAPATRAPCHFLNMPSLSPLLSLCTHCSFLPSACYQVLRGWGRGCSLRLSSLILTIATPWGRHPFFIFYFYFFGGGIIVFRELRTQVPTNMSGNINKASGPLGLAFIFPLLTEMCKRRNISLL